MPTNFIGEEIVSAPQTTAVTGFGANVLGQVRTITLTPGTWEVSAQAYCSAAGAPTFGVVAISRSASATEGIDGTNYPGTTSMATAFSPTVGIGGATIGPIRVQVLSGTKVLYLIAQNNGAGGAGDSWYGKIKGVRI